MSETEVPSPPAENETADTADAVRLHASPLVRALLWIAGSIALLLGLVGVFLPVLPTTPFILLAAACYARASEHFYRWLLKNPAFGPMIREWQQHRSIPYRTKRVAVGMMSLSIAVSIWVVSGRLWLQILLATIAVTVGIWLWRLPSRDRPGQSVSSPSSSVDASR